MGKKKPVKQVVLPPGVSLKDFWQAGGSLVNATTVKKQTHTFEGQLIEDEDLPVRQVLSGGIVHRSDVPICLNTDAYSSTHNEILCRKCYPITDAQLERARQQVGRDPLELIHEYIQSLEAGKEAGGAGEQAEPHEPIILPDIVEDLPLG